MRLQKLLLAGPLACSLSACAIDPAAVDLYNARIAAANDLSQDRTQVGRVAAGITKAQAGLSLGCAGVLDLGVSRLLSAYCLSRQVRGLD